MWRKRNGPAFRGLAVYTWTQSGRESYKALGVYEPCILRYMRVSEQPIWECHTRFPYNDL